MSSIERIEYVARLAIVREKVKNLKAAVWSHINSVERQIDIINDDKTSIEIRAEAIESILYDCKSLLGTCDEI